MSKIIKVNGFPECVGAKERLLKCMIIRQTHMSRYAGMQCQMSMEVTQVLMVIKFFAIANGIRMLLVHGVWMLTLKCPITARRWDQRANMKTVVKFSVRVVVKVAMTMRAMVRAIVWAKAKVRVRLRVNTKVIDYNCI